MVYKLSPLLDCHVDSCRLRIFVPIDRELFLRLVPTLEFRNPLRQLLGKAPGNIILSCAAVSLLHPAPLIVLETSSRTRRELLFGSLERRSHRLIELRKLLVVADRMLDG